MTWAKVASEWINHDNRQELGIMELLGELSNLFNRLRSLEDIAYQRKDSDTLIKHWMQDQMQSGYGFESNDDLLDTIQHCFESLYNVNKILLEKTEAIHRLMPIRVGERYISTKCS